jgi:hypothetical protein
MGGGFKEDHRVSVGAVGASSTSRNEPAGRDNGDGGSTDGAVPWIWYNDDDDDDSKEELRCRIPEAS